LLQVKLFAAEVIVKQIRGLGRIGPVPTLMMPQREGSAVFRLSAAFSIGEPARQRQLRAAILPAPPPPAIVCKTSKYRTAVR